MQTSEIKGSYDKEALRKYSQSFVLRKRKNKSEKQLENTDDMYLVDQLVKLVFLNITVGDKKVLDYKLNEPFNTLKELKFLSGVEDGT